MKLIWSDWPQRGYQQTAQLWERWKCSWMFGVDACFPFSMIIREQTEQLCVTTWLLIGMHISFSMVSREQRLIHLHLHLHLHLHWEHLADAFTYSKHTTLSVCKTFGNSWRGTTRRMLKSKDASERPDHDLRWRSSVTQNLCVESADFLNRVDLW